jgi:sterol desaturase/sphingolipid hydroxylase (fatty acid hydroxylase superfamily)
VSIHLAIAAVSGALTWTLLEYTIHRWLGHDRRFRPNPFASEHVRHHVEGGYFAPTWKKLGVASMVGVVLGGAGHLVLGAPGVAFVAGLLAMYGAYEILHRLEHVHAGIGPYGRWARHHHFHHHFVDARTNHGVTSPIWDFVFGTYRKPSVIPVPQKLAMRWLLDERGDVKAELRGRYAIKTAPTSTG